MPLWLHIAIWFIWIMWTGRMVIECAIAVYVECVDMFIDALDSSTYWGILTAVWVSWNIWG